MTDPIQLATDNMKWFVGGVLGAFVIVVGALWKLMEGWRVFWKDAYEKKQKEYEYVVQNPKELADKMFQAWKDGLSGQINQLNSELQQLKVAYNAQRGDINMLEQQIAAYEVTISELQSKVKTASAAIAFIKDESLSELSANTRRTLNSLLRKIDPSSPAAKRAIARERSRAEREGVTSAEEAMREKREAEAKAEAQFKQALAVPLTYDDPRKNKHK